MKRRAFLSGLAFLLGTGTAIAQYKPGFGFGRSGFTFLDLTATELVTQLRTLGAGTASGVTFAQLAEGATITNPDTVPGSYFAITPQGVVSTTNAFVSAALGNTTLDIPITGGGNVATLRVKVNAGEVDVDTGAKLSAALTAASASADTITFLTDTFVDGTAFTATKLFNGTITHANQGKTVADSIANPASISLTAVPTMSGGSFTIQARTPNIPRFNNKITLQGTGPLAMDGIAARLAPSQDVYNAKFNEVVQSVLWKPSVNATGSTGRSRAVPSASAPTVFTQTGHGQAVGDVMSFAIPTSTVTISNASPTIVTWNNHNFQPGDSVFFAVSSGGSLPAGMATGTQTGGTAYTVRTVESANTFTLSKPDGTVLNTTSAGSGTFTGTVRLLGGFTAGTQYNIASIPDANSYTLAAYKGGPAIVGTGVTSPLNATFVAFGVNGLGVMDRTGIGYLANAAERRVYIAIKASGPGSNFQGYFDANDDGTIDATSPLYIVNPGTGYTTSTQFRQPTLQETTQLQTCQSNTLPASSTVQIQISASTTGVLSKVILRNGSSGNPGGSINRIGHCIDVRNADQLYVHDWSMNNYWLGIQVYFGNDVEFSRIFSKGNANDFYRQYPSTSPVGSQAVNGPQVRVLSPVGVAPLSVIDHSNEHADIIQIGTPSDQTQKHNLIFRFGRFFWPGNIREHQTQFILNTMSPIPYIHDISDNFAITSTQNAQMGSTQDPAQSQFCRNTYLRYMENNPTENEFSAGYPACIETWIIHKGVYSSSTNYSYGDVVSDGASPPNYYGSKFNGTNNNRSLSDTTYWLPYPKYDIQLNDNIVGAIWPTIPTATSVDKSKLHTTNPAGGVFTSGILTYHALRNAFISNYTPNNGNGDSFPEVFAGGAAFFDTFVTDVGWTNFKNKIPTTGYIEARDAIDAAFATKPSGHAAVGRGYLQAAA